MTTQRLTKALQKFVKKVRDERLRGTLGRLNSDGTVTVEAPRQNFVYVTLPDGTVTQLPNTGRGHVPERDNLPVFIIRRHNGDLELDGYDDSLLGGDAYLPGPHGVLPHASSHQDGGTDEVATATPGANAIVKADADGKIGAGWLDPADLGGGDFTDLDDVPSSYSGQAGKILFVNGTEDAIVFGTGSGGAVDSVNGLTGIVVLDPDDLDDTATTNKFTTAAEITKLAGIETGADVTDAGNVGSAINSASTDDTIDDTDTFGYTTGSTLKKSAWSNLKSLLTTVFNALYAPIAKGVTNGDTHDHNGGDGAQIDHTTLSNIGTNTHAQVDTHIASTSNPHSVTKSQVGLGNADNTSDATKNAAAVSITNHTYGSTNIASLTAKNPPTDADSVVIVDSAASNVFKAVTYTNIKAFLKTYFDTLYELAGAIATHAALTTTHGVTGNIVGTGGAQTLTGPKTLTAPVIADFTASGHTHQNAAGGGTLDHGAALTGLSDNDHPQYLLVNGTLATGVSVLETYFDDLGTVTSTGTITIDITGSARRTYVVEFDYSGHQSGSDNIYAFFNGRVTFTRVNAGTTTIRSADVEHGTSGTDACTLTTITDGIRILIDSSAFGNSMNVNTLYIRALNDISVSVVIA